MISREQLYHYFKQTNRLAEYRHLLSANNSLLRLSDKYWLEAADPEHREGKWLAEEYRTWLKKNAQKHDLNLFFHAIHGKGKDKRISFQESSTNVVHFDMIENKLVDSQAKPINTTHLKGRVTEHAAVIINMDGSIHIHEHKQNAFHHSSFNGGKPVLFAGFIRIANGKITDINNLTGHYKTNKERLHFASDLLQRYMTPTCKVTQLSKIYEAGSKLSRVENPSWLRLKVASILKSIGSSSLFHVIYKPKKNRFANITDANEYLGIVRQSINEYILTNPNKFKNIHSAAKDAGVKRVVELEKAVNRVDHILKFSGMENSEKIALIHKHLATSVDNITTKSSYSLFHRDRQFGLDSILNRNLIAGKKVIKTFSSAHPPEDASRRIQAHLARKI